jgi:ABC-type uncharacterized transport system permease subunit
LTKDDEMTYETAFTLAVVAGLAGGGFWAMILEDFTPGFNAKNVVETIVAALASFAIVLSILKVLFE